MDNKAASVGLSRDPPVPDILTTSEVVRERLIAGRKPSLEARETRVSSRRDECAPRRGGLPTSQSSVGPETDRAVHVDQPAQMRELSGRGPSEIPTWGAVRAAQTIPGDARRRLVFYEPIDGSIAGMAMLSAVQHAS